MMRLTLIISFFMCLFVNAQSPAERREKAADLEKNGNWKEAREIRVALLNEVADEKSGEDLELLSQSLARLHEWSEFDGMIKKALVKQDGNFDFLIAASKSYANSPHYGGVLDGEFQRGRQQNRGEWRNVAEQDRIIALNLAREAWDLAGDDQKKLVATYETFLGALLSSRTSSNESWQLAELTNFSDWPDLNEDRSRSVGSGGAAVTADGTPLYFDLPESWEKAASDGERWRWLRAEIGKLDADRGAAQEMRWWNFSEGQFGVTTLVQFSWWKKQDPEKQKGILQLETLKEDETIANLATGVSRFSLREDYRFIAGYRALMKAGKGGYYEMAGDQLVGVFLNRRQFVAAEKTLREVIALHGAGQKDERKERLKQIVGAWGQFEHTGTFFADDEVKVPFLSRNAVAVKLTLHRIDAEKVMADTFKYLEGNPREIDYQKTRLNRIGQRLLEKNLSKYLGEELKAWEAPLQELPDHQDNLNQLSLGKLEPGTYWLKADLPDGNHGWTVLWVRDLVLIKRSEKEGIVFYLAEAKNGQPVQGELEFFGYRIEQREKNNLLRNYDVVTEHFRAKTDENGRYVLPQEKSKGSMTQSIIARADKRRAFLDQHRWYWNENREDVYQVQKAFGMSDLPLYRPGQKVHLKFWTAEARYDLDDDRKFANKNCAIEIRDGQGNLILERKDLRTDEKAAVSLEFDLPEDASLGSYQVMLMGENVPNAALNFRVEEYKKPEYEVSIDAPEKPVTLGEKFEATVKATYYHGAPVTEAEVKVTVMRSEFNDFWFPPAPWDWLYGPGYWWFAPSYEWMPGWHSWGCVRPAPPWWGRGRGTPPELILDKTYPIGIDGMVKVEIDTSLAKLVHGDQDHRYEITAEVVDSSRRTIVGKDSILAAREPFKVTTWLDQGYAKVGDEVTGHFAARSLDGKKVEGKAEAYLFRVLSDENGKITEKEVKKWSIEGESWTFNASEAGQFRVAVRVTDEKNRVIEGASVFVVRGEAADAKDFIFNHLELIPDKKEYRPGETLKLLVNVNRPGSRVWLFVRPEEGKKEETRIFTIEGKSQVVEIPLDLGDMPNIFVEGMVVSEGEIHSVTREIVLPPEKRQLTVEVEPAKKRLKPREKTKLTIRLRDSDGKPFQGEAVLTVYDKSMEYISGGSNVPDIQKFFWDWKRHYYQRGVESSQNFHGQNLLRQKDARMQILGIFGGQQFRGDMAGEAFASGGSLFGGMAKNPPAAPAPMIMSRQAKSEMVLENSASDTMLSSLGNEEESGPEVIVRSDFADLLKWVGNIVTDEKGEAEIELEMPDNLTTWKIKTWAMGAGTKVGEGSAEIITSKDLLVRLQAPRFFIESDEVTLSAIVHNYHKEAKEVAVSLEMDGGLLSTSDPASSNVAIPAGGETRVDWTAKVSGEGEATIRMKAIANDDADAMEMKFPVYIHGMLRTESYSRAISAEQNSAVIPFTIPEESRPSDSKLIVRYSPSVAAAMVEALPYLANYPYESTDQTLNRFVPMVVTHDLLKSMNLDLAAIKNQKIKLNPQELPGGKEDELRQLKHPDWNPVWDGAEVAKMEREGLKKLRAQQNRDGGWGWFSAFGGDSYPHTTAVVMHGLLLAQDHGTKVPGDMIERGLAWLEKYENKELEKIANWEIREENTKQRADATDALVRRVLGEGGKENEKMREFLFRDKIDLPIYAKCLLGLELHRVGKNAERDEVLRNIEQFLKTDDENQTAWLDLGNRGYWWYWYGSDFEAQAWYLKLISAVKPKSKEASGVAKYLINNRRHATYWNATRDTAYCLEALGDYIKASGESAPDLEVEVLLDGNVLKTVKITKDNMFTFDGTVTVTGDILTAGEHKIELRKKGDGPLYANAYVTVFTLEDFIKKAGLEVKVERRFYKLVPEKTADSVPGERGQALKQQGQKYKREELAVGDSVASGDLIEVELSVESKNDYEYLIFEDWKAAGLEPVEVRSGYNPNGLGAYMELRDEKVSLFVQDLPQGRHNLSYRLRAEIPGKFSALPTRAEAIYAPELKANSDEMKIEVTERK